MLLLPKYLISKKKISYFKWIILSPMMELLLIFLYLVSIPFLALYPKPSAKLTQYEIIVDLKQIFRIDIFDSIENID